jgi:hypothetical protein
LLAVSLLGKLLMPYQGRRLSQHQRRSQIQITDTILVESTLSTPWITGAIAYRSQGWMLAKFYAPLHELLALMMMLNFS